MREIGRLSDEWIGHWVVLFGGLVVRIDWRGDYENTWFTAQLVCTWDQRGIPVVERGYNNPIYRIDWDRTAKIADYLIAILAGEHPNSAVLLGPFHDHIKERGA